MKVINRQKEAIPAALSLQEFGKAMAQLDLSGIPKDKRPAAIADHLGRIMAETVTDPVAKRRLIDARVRKLLNP